MNIKLLIFVLAALVPKIAIAQALPPGVIFEPSTKINVEVSVSSIILQADMFLYSYKVCSKQDSRQNIYHITFELSEFPQQPLAPQGWTPPDENFFMVDRDRKGETGIKIYGWLSDDTNNFDIKPGQCAEGFSFKSAKMPGIKAYFAQGFTKDDLPRMAHGGEPSEEDEEAFGDLADFFINSVSSKTVLPDVEASTSPVVLIDRLISLKHQAAQLGWIYGPGSDGIVNSLDVKLEAAKKSVLGNKNKTAVNQLKAFINEIEAQRGKHLNDNAYYLLKINAEFIVSGLGL